MKKSLILTLLFLFSFSFTALAKPTAEDLQAVKQLSTQLTKEKANYDPNSIRSLASTTFSTELKDKEGKSTTVSVRAMFVEYAILNDKLFYKTHKELFFFDETNKVFLEPATIEENPTAATFISQYEQETGAHLHYIGPLLILSGLLLFSYLTLRYVDKNMYSSFKTKSA